jgi:hypothetical protein
VTFIVSEDEALRNMLLVMTVSDAKNSARPVGVWFGQPDPEIRAQSFPFITIDLIDISEATERVMSGKAEPWYFAPDDLEEDEGWDMYLPIPINLDYQVTTFARQPRHDRQILGQLLGNRLPLRFGSLPVVEFLTEDTIDDEEIIVGQATVRRLDVLNVLKRDITEAGKRMFMNVFTVRISSEIPQPYDFATYKKAAEIRIKSGNYHPNSPFPRLPYEVIEVTVPAQSGTP